jgi:hypothetical protein
MCVIDLINVESINTHFIEIYSDLFETILQSKKDSLIENYLAEEKSSLIRNYLTEQEKYKFII